jgi:AraC-like DNA-binding protein
MDENDVFCKYRGASIELSSTIRRRPIHVQLVGMTPENTTRSRAHSHSVWEVVYYFAGTGTLTIDGRRLPFGVGDIVCEPAGMVHSEFAENGFRDIYVRVEDFRPPAPGVLLYKDDVSKGFFGILIQLYREFHLKQKNWPTIVDSLFLVLYQYMVAWTDASDKNRFVEEFERVLVSNIANAHFRVGDALRAVPFSRDHFRRLFRTETGYSPLDYLRRKRIEHAKRLLEYGGSSKRKIKDICALCGFEDQYYFSRVFKKVAGKSPTDWERRVE